MRPICLKLATRTARLAALAVCGVVLTGCQGVTGLQQAAQVRIIDASPDAPALDIAQSLPATAVPNGLYNIGFGTVSSYIPMAAGTYTHSAYVAGTQQQLALARGSFVPGGQYTLLAGNIAAGLQMAFLKDQSTPAPSGQMALRFLGQATRSGAVDLYLLPAGFSLNGALPIATGVNFGTNTGYINAPAGTYSIIAYPAGIAPSASSPSFTGSQMAYPATSVRTIVLLDQRNDASEFAAPSSAHSLQVVTASDYDPSAS
jgi:Domain of unknown function (DUF4397)